MTTVSYKYTKKTANYTLWQRQSTEEIENVFYAITIRVVVTRHRLHGPCSLGCISESNRGCCSRCLHLAWNQSPVKRAEISQEIGMVNLRYLRALIPPRDRKGVEDHPSVSSCSRDASLFCLHSLYASSLRRKEKGTCRPPPPLPLP